jgi:PAS domain S-box-containing protein
MVTETLADGALGASGIAAWRWDIEARRIDWSGSAEEVLGLPDIVLRSPDLLTRAIHPDDLPLVSSAYGDALRHGTQMEARFRIMSPAGVHWFDCSGRPVLDESGKAVAATGTVLDVTEECEAEDAMLQSLRDVQGVLGNLGARVWEFDSDSGTIQYTSPPTGPMIFENDDGELQLDYALSRLSDEDAAMVRDKLRRTIETGDPLSYEVSVPDDDGVVHRVFVRGGRSSTSPRGITGVTIVLD